MTVNTSTSRKSYNGNGTTTEFSYPFRILESSHLEVILVDSSGNETVQTLGTHYTVTGVGDEGGGSVIMTTAPAADEDLVFVRRMPFTQNIDYVSGDPFPAETHERGLDERVMETQEIKEIVDRSLAVPVQESGLGTLPAAIARANRLLAFDGGGDPEASTFTMAEVQTAINAAGQGVGVGDTSTIMHDQDGTSYNLETFLNNRKVFSVKDYGAVGGLQGDDAAAIQACLDAAAAYIAFHSNSRTVVVDFGTDRYNVGSLIHFNGIAGSIIFGNFRLQSIHDGDCVAMMSDCNISRVIGRMEVYCRGSATFSGRTNLYGLVIDNCPKLLIDNLSVYWAVADGVRVVGTSSQFKVGLLETGYCGSATPGSVSADTATVDAQAQTGGVNSTSQRSVLTMSAVPQQLKDYLDVNIGTNGTVKAAFLRINGKCFFVESYSGDDLTVWPWMNTADVGQTADFIFGAGLFSTGGDTSVISVDKHDKRVCGIGYAGFSLYPATYGSFVSQNCGIALLIGASTSSAGVGYDCQRGYFESNVFDIIQGSQANIPMNIVQNTALDWGKCQRLWSGNSAGVPVNTRFSEFSAGDDLGQRYSSNAYQFSGSAYPLRMYLPDDAYYFNANTLTLNIEDDQDLANLFERRNKSVYWYNNVNGMAPSGSITFTPPAGGTINGLTVDTPQVFDTATAPQQFIVSRADALTWFVEALNPATINKV